MPPDHEFIYFSPALNAMNLPILTCSYCMRKVGLWNFHQMEGMCGDGEIILNTAGQSAQASGLASAATHESQGDQSASATSATTPCRMKLRSQDSTRSDQASFTKEGKPAKLFRFIKYVHVIRIIVYNCG